MQYQFAIWEKNPHIEADVVVFVIGNVVFVSNNGSLLHGRITLSNGIRVILFYSYFQSNLMQVHGTVWWLIVIFLNWISIELKMHSNIQCHGMVQGATKNKYLEIAVNGRDEGVRDRVKWGINKNGKNKRPVKIWSSTKTANLTS